MTRPWPSTDQLVCLGGLLMLLASPALHAQAPASPTSADPATASPAATDAESPAALAEPGSVSVAAEPMEVTVGGRVRATLTAVWMGAEPSAEVRFPTWQETWGQAEVVTTSPVEATIDDAGRRVWRQTVELTAWEAGLVDLPSVTVAVPLAERTVELATDVPAAAFTVVSVLPAEDETAANTAPTMPGAPPTADAAADPIAPRPSAPPAELRRVEQRFWLTAGILGLGLVIATVSLLRRLGALPWITDAIDAVFDPYAGMTPLDELAARLDRLDADDAGQAHTGISLALRRFLGRRLDAPSVESTTTEIQRDLQRRAIPAELGQRAVQLLRDCDLVKFAGTEADRPTTESRRDAARQIARHLEQHLAPATETESPQEAPA